jgi:ketosteroid isomerase-like protein
MRRSLPLLLFVVLLTAACAPPAAAPPPPAAPQVDLAAEETALRAADAAWLKAAQARDAAGEVAALAPNAIVVRQNQPPMDNAAFAPYLTKDYAENPKAQTNWTTDTIRIAESGAWAVQTGQWVITNAGSKGDETDSGRFVTIWTKVDGAWKVAQDTSVSTTPVKK